MKHTQLYRVLTLILALLIVAAATPAFAATAPIAPGRGSRILVAYFSATGSTRRVAQEIADDLDADLFEITPEEPYTASDLNYSDPDSRVSREHDDPSLRNIALAQTIPNNWDFYDTVFIGYPIWWGIAAWPVSSFVSSNDFASKTVIPFCTSSSSGLGDSATLLQSASGDTGTWLEGQRFSSGASEEQIEAWIDTLELPEPPESDSDDLAISDTAPDGLTIEDLEDSAAERVLYGIQAGSADDHSTVAELLTWIAVPEGCEVHMLNADGTETASDDPVCTGQMIETSMPGDSPELTAIVVTGDALGSGIMQLSQVIRVARAYSGTEPLEGLYLDAVDFQHTGDITLSDLVSEAALFRAAGLTA